MLGQACLLEIIQMEKKRKKKSHHVGSLAFLNRPSAIFTPEIAQSHEIKPCSVKPAKQKDSFQAGTLTEGPLCAGWIRTSASWLSQPPSAQDLREICRGQGQIALETLLDLFSLQRIWKGSQRVESRFGCGLYHRTSAREAQDVAIRGAAAGGAHHPPSWSTLFPPSPLPPTSLSLTYLPSLSHPLSSIFPSLFLLFLFCLLSLPLNSAGAPRGPLLISPAVAWKI